MKIVRTFPSSKHTRDHAYQLKFHEGQRRECRKAGLHGNMGTINGLPVVVGAVAEQLESQSQPQI